PSDAGSVRRGRRMHRQSRRVRRGPTRRATPRHAGAEEHLRRRADPRCLSGRGARVDARGLALRAVRAGAASARGAAGRGRAVDPGALRAARRPRGLRAGAAPGGAEGTAGDGRRTPEAGFGGRQNSVMLSPALSWNADRSWQIPARIGTARAAAADAEHVDSTAHVELHGRTAVEPDLQVAIAPDP